MYGHGKFFFIRSLLNELVLDIKDAIANPGQVVSPWEYQGGDNQIWYEDHIYGVIRSLMDSNLVLHSENDCLVVEEFRPDEYSQRWKIAGNKICNRDDPNMVLDIADSCTEPDAKVSAWEYQGGDNQLWDINYLPPKRFNIISKMNNKVFRVKGGEVGSRVVMHSMGDNDDRELWYEDKKGVIYSCYNNMALSTAGGPLCVENYDPQVPDMQWNVTGSRIAKRSDPSLTLDIKNGKDKDNAKIIENYYQGAGNQLFDFDYIE